MKHFALLMYVTVERAKNGTAKGSDDLKPDYTKAVLTYKDKEEIIDTENVTAISVNGTVYELK